MELVVQPLNLHLQAEIGKSLLDVLRSHHILRTKAKLSKTLEFISGIQFKPEHIFREP